ncbi:hypothetical protein HK097_005571 [Rhizophlyctis rosea]|uniref:Uncharacterized protein n=1 Tax=Rhizophlyctis rosea TaxID=64517 RepID=A0AAD5X356_9FUNG|nr:hypothetical protein HK097_005571 [Rhizophlyctis rosea]
MPSFSRLIRRKSSSAPQLKVPDDRPSPGKKDQSSNKGGDRRLPQPIAPSQSRPEVQPPINSKGKVKSAASSDRPNIYQLPQTAGSAHHTVGTSGVAKRGGLKRASAPTAALQCSSFPLSILKRPVSSPPASTRTPSRPQSPHSVRKAPSVHFKDRADRSNPLPFDPVVKIIRPQHVEGNAKQPSSHHENNILRELRSWAGSKESLREAAQQQLHPQQSRPQQSHPHERMHRDQSSHQYPQYASPHIPQQPIPQRDDSRRLPHYTIPINDSPNIPLPPVPETPERETYAYARHAERDPYVQPRRSYSQDAHRAQDADYGKNWAPACVETRRDGSPGRNQPCSPRWTGRQSQQPTTNYQPDAYRFPLRSDSTSPASPARQPVRQNTASQESLRGVSKLKSAFEAKMAHESRLGQRNTPTPPLTEQRRGSSANSVRGGVTDQRKNSGTTTAVTKLSARTAAAEAKIRSLEEEMDALRQELALRKRSEQKEKEKEKKAGVTLSNGDAQRAADYDLLLSYVNDMMQVTSELSNLCKGNPNLWNDQELVLPSPTDSCSQVPLFVAHLTYLLRTAQRIAHRAGQLDILVRGRSRSNTLVRGQVLAMVGQEVKDIEELILGAEQERKRWEGAEEGQKKQGSGAWDGYYDDDTLTATELDLEVERYRGSNVTELMSDQLSKRSPSPSSTDDTLSEDLQDGAASAVGVQTKKVDGGGQATNATLTNQLALANLLVHTHQDIISELESQLEGSYNEVDRLNQHNWELKLQNEHLKAMGEAKERVVAELLRRLGEVEDAKSTAGMVKTFMALIDASDVTRGEEEDEVKKVVPNLAGMLGLRSVRSADRILLADPPPPPSGPLPSVPPQASAITDYKNDPLEGRKSSVALLYSMERTKTPTSPPMRPTPSPGPTMPRAGTPHSGMRPRATARARPATPMARKGPAGPTPPASPKPNENMVIGAGRSRAASTGPPPAVRVNRSRRVDNVATFPGRKAGEGVGTFPRPGTVTTKAKGTAGKVIVSAAPTGTPAGVRSGLPTPTPARSTRMPTPPTSPRMNGILKNNSTAAQQS